MTANALIRQALGLKASYFVLNSKLKQIPFINIDRKELLIAGLAQSASIILPFALEIAFKGLLKYRHGSFPRIHDLMKLYKILDINDQIEISKLYKEKTSSDIEICLQRHKDMFMEFRYLELKINEPNDNEKVHAALDAVIDFYNQIKNNTQ